MQWPLACGPKWIRLTFLKYGTKIYVFQGAKKMSEIQSCRLKKNLMVKLSLPNLAKAAIF